MKKIFILGIDGGTLSLIERWLEHLPSFRKFFKKATYAPLKTTIPPLSPSAWTSFMTGTHPGTHGILEFYYLDRNFKLRVATRNKRVKTIWRYLSDTGKKVVSLGVPMTYPPEPVNGIMVSSILTPSMDVDFTYPRSFKEELLKNIPDYRIVEDTKYTEREEDKEAYRDAMFRMMDARFRAALYIMERYPWDVFMVTFMGVDHAQHWFWRYMDPTHPKYVKDERFSNTIFEAYRKMDEVLGFFMENLPPEATLIIMSDHGGGPCYGSVNLNYYLMKTGFLKLKRKPITVAKEFLYIFDVTPYSIGRFLIGKGMAKRVAKIRMQGRRKLANLIGLTYRDIDWGKTKAYAFGCYGPVFINTKSRSPLGCVDEKDFEKVRREVLHALMKIEDPVKKKPLITRWWKGEELYGKKEWAPDIVIAMGDFSYTTSVFAFPSFRLFTDPLTFKSGDHTLYGVFGIMGEGIPEGKKLKEVSIVDIAPTIYRILGVQPPPWLEGKPLFQPVKVR